MTDLHKDLKSLGNTGTKYVYDRPQPELLETFPSPFADKQFNACDADGEIYIRCPEFTCLCPKTGQPDFATIIITYIPNELCVESKSLKLYLGSFRMFGEFHEACVTRICNDLVELLHPLYLKIEGQFAPRGGIPFWPTAVYVQGEIECKK